MSILIIDQKNAEKRPLLDQNMPKFSKCFTLKILYTLFIYWRSKNGHFWGKWRRLEKHTYALERCIHQLRTTFGDFEINEAKPIFQLQISCSTN